MLILVRHGRTAANAQRLLLGRLDPPLDDEGRRQAARLREAVGSFDHIRSSPLQRTRETAQAIAGAVTVDVDPRWVEIDYGNYDGLPLADVPPDMWRAWRSDPSFTPPGGESLASLQARVAAACDDLRAEAEAHDVVVVSHVSPIKAAVAWALGAGPELAWKLFLQPASITRIAVGPTGPVIHSFNEAGHLLGDA
ncbi:MAG TPA: histidine phosphatase family protein [Acidimicrobiales bacterium]|jgi:probable phosphoglycerate mutase|nr:histidine phosphatase family protein [Acidimicrobiales bacterium]